MNIFKEIVLRIALARSGVRASTRDEVVKASYVMDSWRKTQKKINQNNEGVK